MTSDEQDGFELVARHSALSFLPTQARLCLERSHGPKINCARAAAPRASTGCRKTDFLSVKRRGVNMFIRLFKVAPVALACALSFSLAAPSFAHLVSADGHAAKVVNSAEDQPGTLTLAPEVDAAAAQDVSNSTST